MVLRPREIQDRVRAGASVDELVELTGMPARRIEPFAHPVLAERARIAELGRQSRPRRADGPAQLTLWEILATAFAARGLDQVRGLITIERILGELTGSHGFRDPGNYALAIVGDPAGNGPWAWRFEGHHLSLSALVAPGHGVSVTPAFFGANPARVPAGHAHGGQAAILIDMPTRLRVTEVCRDVCEYDDGELQPLGFVDRHDPDAFAAFLEDRGLASDGGLGLVA